MLLSVDVLLQREQAFVSKASATTAASPLLKTSLSEVEEYVVSVGDVDICGMLVTLVALLMVSAMLSLLLLLLCRKSILNGAIVVRY